MPSFQKQIHSAFLHVYRYQGYDYTNTIKNLLHVNLCVLHLFWIAKQDVKITDKNYTVGFLYKPGCLETKNCFYSTSCYIIMECHYCICMICTICTNYGILDSYLSLWCGTEVLCLHRVHYGIIPAQGICILSPHLKEK